MTKEEKKSFAEMFAKICDNKDIISGERLWYLRVDDSEKMLKNWITEHDKIEKERLLKLIDDLEESLDNQETYYNRISFNQALDYVREEINNK